MNLFWYFINKPEFLFLLFLIPLLVYIEVKRKSKWMIFKHSDIIKNVFYRSSFRFYLEMFLKVIIFLLFVIILSDPWQINTKTKESKNWIDIAIALDISKSMLAEDITPSRIESAKNVLRDFIADRTNDRLSLTLFAWKPFISVPITFDRTALWNFISNIDTDSINQTVPWLSWTAIWDALIRSSDSLMTSKWDKLRSKVIILVTDGEANLWVDPLIAMKYVKNKGIKIYSIWIWSSSWTELFVTDSFWNRQYFLDSSWKPIIAKLDEKMLKQISLSTWGNYYNAESSDSLKRVFESLDKLNKTKAELEISKAFKEDYFEFLVALLCSFAFLQFVQIKNSLKF